MMASEFAMIPPIISATMKDKENATAVFSFLTLASDLVSERPPCACPWPS